MWVDSPFPTLGQWSHWVYTLKSTDTPPITAYKNNAPATVDENECCPVYSLDSTLKNELVFGNHYVDNHVGHPYYPDVDIDEVLMFDYILSAGEVTLLYNAQS